MRSRVDRARIARGRGFCSRTPSIFFSSVGNGGEAGYIGLSSAGRRGWGGRSPTPRLAERRKIVCQTIMHRVMLLTGQAEQVPRTPGVLGIILRGPDVVHGRGINRAAEPCRLTALVPVAPQDAAPQFSPARCVITCPSHADLRVGSDLPAIGLSPPGKTKRLEPTNTLSREFHRLRSSRHWPAAIFTINRRLHFRQYNGCRELCISGVISWRRLRRPCRRQSGHIAYPSITGNSVPHFCFDCNTFCLLFALCLQIKHSVQVVTFYRSIILDSLV